MKTGILAALTVLLASTAVLADTYRIDTISPYLPAMQTVVAQVPAAPVYVESYSPVIGAPIMAGPLVQPTVVYSPAPYYAWQIPSYFYVPGRAVVRQRTYYRPRGARTVVRYW